jgi:hypothetical protein
MAYSKNNLALVTEGIGGFGSKFQYTSADPIATVNTSGYFSDGYHMGMRVGDTVEVRDTVTPTTSLCSVAASSSTTGIADVTDGTAVSQTNSD